ncbi:MAG: hypothetical protein AAF462_07455 [Thermodesulfobacteriota bacterium]
MRKFLTSLTVLFMVIMLSSCGVTKFVGYYASAGDEDQGDLEGQIFRSEDTSYQIGTLPSGWTRHNVEGGDLAYKNTGFDATMTINSTCNEKKKNYSLKALSESLLIGIKDKEAIERTEIAVSGQPALRTIYTGSLNEVPIKIATVVFRKDFCIFDFTYASSPQDFDKGIGDFDNFLSQFKAL